MNITRRFALAAGVGGAFSAVSLSLPLRARAQSLSPVEAQQIAEDAYIYGYSLITTEVTRVR